MSRPSPHSIYTVLAQDAADFATPSSPEIALPLTPIQAGHEQCTRPSNMNKLQLLFENNKGLLLVAASQAFFAFMNTAVKKLNSVDPPVPALELVLVRMVSIQHLYIERSEVFISGHR
jgi:hypothetical protein